MNRNVKRTLGITLQVLSILGTLILVVINTLARLSFFMLLIAYPFAILYGVGSRLRKHSAEERLLKDRRQPVLFLRPFEKDRQVMKRPLFIIQFLLSLPWEYIWVLPKLTFEESIDIILRHLGPTIALGRPNEFLEPAGVARTYAGDDWQDRVIEMAEKSQLVAIIPDDRPSVIWELVELVKLKGLSKTMIVLPIEGKGKCPTRSSDWYTNWEMLRQKVAYLPAVTDTTAAIRFDHDSNPQLIQAKSAKAIEQLRAIEENVRGELIAKSTSPAMKNRWIVRRAVFYLFWLIIIPAVSSCIGIDLSMNYLICFFYFCYFSTILYFIRKVLPFSRIAKVNLDDHPIRTYDPMKRIRLRLRFIGIFFLILLIRAYLVDSFIVPNASMFPSIKAGEQILVDKRAYGLQLPWIGKRIFSTLPPQRGDVILFRRQEGRLSCKRVIGIPGDVIIFNDGIPTIEQIPITSEKAGMFVSPDSNKVAMYLEQIQDRQYYISFLYFENERIGIMQQGPYIVLPDEVFVVGDARNSSFDSRYWEGEHGIPFEDILGKVILPYRANYGQPKIPRGYARLPEQ